MAAPTANTTTAYQAGSVDSDDGASMCSTASNTEPSTADSASAIVMKLRHVRSRQHGSPRILMSPAPNSTRNSSHRSSTMMSTGGSVSPLPRNAARNPASSRSDSQPKL